MAKNGIDVYAHAARRRVRWGRLSLLLGCIIVVGGVLLWQVASHPGNAATPLFPAASGSGPLSPPVPLTTMYSESVKEQVAHGLRLTVAQVTAQLQAEPTPDLRGIGKQQGLAQDQLYRLVLKALQTADDRMITSGTWIQRQADEEQQYWSQQTQLSLISGVTTWFLQH